MGTRRLLLTCLRVGVSKKPIIVKVIFCMIVGILLQLAHTYSVNYHSYSQA